MLSLELTKSFGKNLFWIESFAKTDDLTEAAQALAATLGVPISNSTVKSRSKGEAGARFQVLPNDCPTFTNRSTPYSLRYSKHGVGALIQFALLIVFLAVLPYFYSGHERDVMTRMSIGMAVLFLLKIGWSIPLAYLAAKPWALTLDFGTRKYRLDEGFALLSRHESGPFDDLAGVRISERRTYEDGKPFLVTLSFKNRKDHKPFPLFQCISRAEADQAADALRSVSGLGFADAWGNVVGPYEERFSAANVVTYTHESIKQKYSRRRLTIEGVIKLFLPLAVTPVLLWHPIPGRPIGIMIFVIVTIGLWFLAYLSLKDAAPWSVTLDYSNKEYAITDGFWPFTTRQQGSFRELIGVTSIQALNYLYSDPFDITICVKRLLGKKYYHIEPAQTAPEANRRVTELSARMDIPIVEPPSSS